MIISLVAARSRNNVIGIKNRLPWYLPKDLEFFYNLTRNKCVIMGRKSFESIKGFFPWKTIIILSRNKNMTIKSSYVVSNMIDGFLIAEKMDNEEIYILGGGEVYLLAMPYASMIYLTEIDEVFDGDTIFPPILREEWDISTRDYFYQDKENKFNYSFVKYKRLTNPKNYSC